MLTLEWESRAEQKVGVRAQLVGARTRRSSSRQGHHYTEKISCAASLEVEALREVPTEAIPLADLGREPTKAGRVVAAPKHVTAQEAAEVIVEFTSRPAKSSAEYAS